MVEWKKRETKKTGNMWVPAKDGEELVGEVTKVTEGQFGPQWTICKAEGIELVTPSHKVLQNRMEGIAVGEVVRIVFIGTELPAVKGQNGMKMYEVYTS